MQISHAAMIVYPRTVQVEVYSETNTLRETQGNLPMKIVWTKDDDVTSSRRADFKLWRQKNILQMSESWKFYIYSVHKITLKRQELSDINEQDGSKTTLHS